MSSRKGKTYDEFYGPKRAEEVRKRQIEGVKAYYEKNREIFNEPKELENIDSLD